jgi:hypothetical protein
LLHIIGWTCVAMKTCTYCGKEHPDEATECVIDKQPLSPAGSPSTSTNKSRLSSFFSMKVCNIRTSCKILCGMICVATVSFFVMEYIDGRYGIILFFIGPLPAQIVPFLIIFFSSILLAALCIVTLAQRSNRRLAFTMLALSCLFLAPGLIITPPKVVQIGFRQRILATVSPAELREIALVCSTVIPLDGRLPGPWNWSPADEPESRGTWNVLTNRTSLGKLDAPTVIFNHADAVEIDWGGALAGHWGIIIQKNGSVGGDIAPDIRTVGPG